MMGHIDFIADGPVRAQPGRDALRSAQAEADNRSLSAGAKLSIRKLSDEVDAGMSPVLEALKRLASERVLSSLAKRSDIVPVLDGAKPVASWNGVHEALVRALICQDEAELRACFLRDIRWEWLDSSR